MKKTIITLVAVSSIFVMGCNTPKEKLENAEDKVVNAEDELQKAQDEYLADREAYRLETAERFAANERSIAEFEQRIANEKATTKAQYQRDIAALNQKNSDLKKKLEEYKESGKDEWQKFKDELNSDLEKLGQALNDFTVKSTK
jgi:hypothetical protein